MRYNSCLKAKPQYKDKMEAKATDISQTETAPSNA